MNHSGSISRSRISSLFISVMAWGIIEGIKAGGADLPRIQLTAAGAVITQSCRIEIPPGLVIRDTEAQGVLQVGSSNIVIVFTPGSVLRGSAADARPDEYKGYGI